MKQSFSEINLLRSITNDLSINIEFNENSKWYFAFQGKYDIIQRIDNDSEIECIYDAISAFEEENIIDDSLGQFYCVKGWKCFEVKNFSQGIKQFSKSLLISSDAEEKKEAYAGIGICEGRSGNFQAAIENYSSSINIAGVVYVIDPVWERIKIYFLLQEYQKALADIAKIEHLESIVISDVEKLLLSKMNDLINNDSR